MKKEAVTSNIFNGDCLKLMKKIPDGSVDLVVSDVPYRIKTGGTKPEYDESQPTGIFKKQKTDMENRGELKHKWISEVNPNAHNGKLFNHNDIEFKDFLPELFRVLKPKSHCYLMINNTNLNKLINEAIKVGFIEQNLLVWKKNNATPNKYYMKNCEFILMFRKGGAKNINGMGTKSVIEIANILGNKTHPTEKPVSLNEILISNSSNPGEIVLDPFMGSGSCGVACKNLGRSFIGIELDKTYFKIAKERIKNE